MASLTGWIVGSARLKGLGESRVRLFSRVYTKVMHWSRHPHAQIYLAGLSFTEAAFFPIPPDVMLAPMALAKPERAWWYALLTTLASTLGGMLGYVLGMFFWVMIQPYVQSWGYMPSYLHVQGWFQDWGFWAMIVAGFTPIPYKLFTIAAGATTMSLLPFFIAAFIGRGARFFLVASLMKLGGQRMETALRQYIDIIGWSTLIIAVAIFYILR